MLVGWVLVPAPARTRTRELFLEWSCCRRHQNRPQVRPLLAA